MTLPMSEKRGVPTEEQIAWAREAVIEMLVGVQRWPIEELIDRIARRLAERKSPSQGMGAREAAEEIVRRHFREPINATFASRIALVEGLAAIIARHCATPAGDDWKRRYEDEEKIVSRVWEALGCKTYEDAKGRTIWELVAAAQSRITELEGALREIEQRANESSNEPLGERETIYAMHKIARTVLSMSGGE